MHESQAVTAGVVPHTCEVLVVEPPSVTVVPPPQNVDDVREQDERLSTQRPATHEAESQLSAPPVPQSQHVEAQSDGTEQTSPAACVPARTDDVEGHMPPD